MNKQEEKALQLYQKIKELTISLGGTIPNLPPDQAIQRMRQAVSRIKESAEATKKNYGRIFDSQISLLQKSGTPEQILVMLKNQREQVLKRASATELGRNRIPFLPVIPNNWSTLVDQLARIQIDGGVGYCSLIRWRDVIDTVPIPHISCNDIWYPYYIFDVDDGREVTVEKLNFKEKEDYSESVFTGRGKMFRQAARDHLSTKKRHPLTLMEAVALCCHSTALSKQALLIAGSTDGDEKASSSPNNLLSIAKHGPYKQEGFVTSFAVTSGCDFFSLKNFGVPSRSFITQPNQNGGFYFTN